VLLAVAGQLVWAPILFQLFTPELLHADAALVGELLAWLLPDVIWRGTTFIAPDGHTIVLIGACSSFNNVSSAALACVTVAMLTRTEWRRRDLATIAIASVVMILANSLRICLLARGDESHLYWHNGIGEQILVIAQTLIILLIAWWGRRAAQGRGMKTNALRGLLLAALVASVGVRFETNRAREAMAGDFDIGAAVEDVIRANGYALRENPVQAAEIARPRSLFSAPGVRASLVGAAALHQ